MQSLYTRIRAGASNLFLFVFVYGIVILSVYLVLVYGIEKSFQFKYNQPAVFYIIFSASAIILTTWGERLGDVICRLFRVSKLKWNIVDQKRIRFSLIFIYFFAIIIFTMASLMSMPIFDIDKMDYSVIQSFATYVAYDRMVRNYLPLQKRDDI